MIGFIIFGAAFVGLAIYAMSSLDPRWESKRLYKYYSKQVEKAGDDDGKLITILQHMDKSLRVHKEGEEFFAIHKSQRANFKELYRSIFKKLGHLMELDKTLESANKTLNGYEESLH